MSQSPALPIPLLSARPAAPTNAVPVWRRAFAWCRRRRAAEIGLHELSDRDIRELGLAPDSFGYRPVWTGYDFDRRS